jgi:hypothetical protein
MFLLLAIIGISCVLAASFLMRRNSEGFAPVAAYESASNVDERFTTAKGLPKPSWGWNPKSDATYAKTQESQCTSGGGKITKYSDAFYMCNGAKW